MLRRPPPVGGEATRGHSPVHFRAVCVCCFLLLGSSHSSVLPFTGCKLSPHSPETPLHLQCSPVQLMTATSSPSYKSFHVTLDVDACLSSTLHIWVGSPCSTRDSQESSPAPQFKSINSLALGFLYGSTLTPIHDYWKNQASARGEATDSALL